MNLLFKNITEYKSSKGVALYKPYEFAAIYDRHLSRFCNTKVNLVEIGVGFGGCLQMWQEYLGSEAMIYGVDHNDTPAIRAIENDRLKFIVGDQDDNEFLKSLPDLIPEIDILIDDGSHICGHQIATFQALFTHLKDGGLYCIEDVHTSYREVYGGGYGRPESFIEYAKRMIDSIHHPEDMRILEENPSLRKICNFIESIYFYRTMVIIKKKGASHVG